MSCQIQLLRADLISGNETLGNGFLTGVEVVHGEYPSSVEIPLAQPVLDYLTNLVARDKVELILRLSGWLRARNDNEDGPRFRGLPEPGSWVYQSFGAARRTDLTIEVARSDWYTSVLQPIGTFEYIATEIRIPHGDLLLRPALNHLHEAERAYTDGDDPAVFARCRAATEALPGAPKQIFTGLADPTEGETLDALLLCANDYFHRGRHVVTEGERQGEFSVTHDDARFALSLARLLVTHVSHILARKAKSARG